MVIQDKELHNLIAFSIRKLVDSKIDVSSNIFKDDKLLQELKEIAGNEGVKKIYIPNHLAWGDNLIFPSYFTKIFNQIPLIAAQTDMVGEGVFKLLEKSLKVVYPVKRETGEDLKNFLKDTEYYIRTGRNVVVYGQGTRQRVGDKPYDFKDAVFGAVKKIKEEVLVIPVCLTHLYIPEVNALSTKKSSSFKVSKLISYLGGFSKSHIHFSKPISSLNYKSRKDLSLAVVEEIRKNVRITPNNILAQAISLNEGSLEERVDLVVNSIAPFYDKFLTNAFTLKQIQKYSQINERSDGQLIDYFKSQTEHLFN